MRDLSGPAGNPQQRSSGAAAAKRHSCCTHTTATACTAARLAGVDAHHRHCLPPLQRGWQGPTHATATALPPPALPYGWPGSTHSSSVQKWCTYLKLLRWRFQSGKVNICSVAAGGSTSRANARMAHAGHSRLHPGVHPNVLLLLLLLGSPCAATPCCPPCLRPRLCAPRSAACRCGVPARTRNAHAMHTSQAAAAGQPG